MRAVLGMSGALERLFRLLCTNPSKQAVDCGEADRELERANEARLKRPLAKRV